MSDNLWKSWQPQDLLADEYPLELDTLTPVAAASNTTHFESDELLQAELTRIRQQAEKKGFAQGEARGIEEGKKRGYEEGLQSGRKEGLEQGLAESRAQQDQGVERLNRLFAEFKSALDSLDCVIPSRLVQLSMTAVRSMLGKQITIDNALLLEKIQRLVEEDTLFKSDIQLWVSQEDVALVEESLGPMLTSLGWELRGDAAMLQGGCRITAADGELDATLETRWQELCNLSREGYF
ncbi:flagellar assembly protein FliH [Citrobacter amalonaticus]|uniref:Flagellar assembly protein FliH n=1 Tax=Citrobacter amalonaticus TaxID=35703 RepID=A0A2S4RPU4_CITAM|nr:flagellar assembly protein FliH [Citrobacter amalonaticus]POT54772.1 flagellar assembly protein FliH [Citrobacter amalonaticus]POT68944.1 flagellar assembly protein FliH [Citrobacter amalonaticus]POU59082.1 flagellar assembly protein FliH [Citrobacter amalonaticus]POV02316.1 flagellar assembly protein FliH [Citrobacter amalonaticus]